MTVLLDTLKHLPPFAPTARLGGVCKCDVGGGAKPKTDKKSLNKRSPAKYVSTTIALKLLSVKSDMHDAYLRTLSCSSFILQEGNVFTSRYCNGRWCLLCNRIRTAKLINGYLTQLDKLKDKQFVTLTVVNCKDFELRDTIKKMNTVIRAIKKYLNKEGIMLTGVRKLECTYNEDDDEYHPHFHFILDKKIEAEILKYEWLRAFPDAKHWAQDIRPADIKSVKELFKYSTKLVVPSKNKKGNKILPKPLDVMFSAMKHLRTFQPMGVKKVSEDIEELQSQVYEDIEGEKALIIPPGEVRVWKWLQHDWVDFTTGEILTGFTPTLNSLSLKHNST